MKITKIKTVGAKHDMLSVYVDNKVCFTVHKKDLEPYDLAVEDVITEDTIKYIKDVVAINSAKFNALNFISYKYRTEKEVKQKLISMGYDIETVDSAVSEISSLGYINDKLYAQKYIFDRSKLNPISKKLLRYNLILKGLSKELAEECIEEFAEDENSVAFSLLEKKFSKLDINEEKTFKKLYSYLKNRGFDHETIMKAVNEAKDSRQI